MPRGNKPGSKRGPYKKRPKQQLEEMSLTEWLQHIHCSTNLPKTSEDLARHKKAIERFLNE